MSTTISELQIGSVIGSGYFGTVHHCQHPVQGDIAIKVIERNPDESQEEWEQKKQELLAEAKHLKIAEHDRVVLVKIFTMDYLYLVNKYKMETMLQN